MNEKQDDYITIPKVEYERLKELVKVLERKMNILIQGIEIQKSTFSHGLELLKKQKNIKI